MVEKRIKRRKPADARRETTVKVLVTSEEHETLQEAAQRAGLSVSTWLRLAGMKAAAERA
ncbi:MAG: plasmid mobilization protein [Polyangiaceae bacterium]